MTIYFYGIHEVPYGCFSNFALYGFDMADRWWPTAEHYFQAQKFAGTRYEEQVRLAATPKQAAEIGRDRHLPLRPDWERVKDDVMRRAVLRKFETHTPLRQLLLATGEEDIIENTKNDYYWGCGQDGNGKNMLGQILGEVRTLLRSYVEVRKIAKALSSIDRLRFIHHLLLEGEMSTIELLKALTMPESTLFTHARILIDAGVITFSKRNNSTGKGKLNYYKIKEIPALVQAFSTLDLPGRGGNEPS